MPASLNNDNVNTKPLWVQRKNIQLYTTGLQVNSQIIKNNVYVAIPNWLGAEEAWHVKIFKKIFELEFEYPVYA